MNKWMKLLLWALAGLAVIVAGHRLRRELQIDRCLDGGGRWDYNASTCEEEPSR